jgi:hypothetical protein
LNPAVLAYLAVGSTLETKNYQPSIVRYLDQVGQSHHGTILKHLKHAFLAYATVLLVSHPGILRSENIGSSRGTVVVADFAHDHVIIAADSRTTTWSHGVKIGVDDTNCKIAILSDDMLFFQLGIGKTVDRNGTVIADPEKIALQSYQSAALFPERPKIKDVAEKWASSMDSVYRHDYSLTGDYLFANTDFNQLGIGGFAGIEPESSSLRVHLAMNSYIKTAEGGVAFVHKVGTLIPNEQGSLHSFGFEKYAVEFSQRQSVRAKAAWKEIANTPQPVGAIEQRALLPQKATEAIIDWSRSPVIGGPIAVIVLEPGKPIRWFAPGACHVQNK